MPSSLPESESTPMLAYEPDHYWAVWQNPESRYAYSIDSDGVGWLIALDSQELGEAFLASDARDNNRLPADYRLDELTLPEAFAAARGQATPFLSSFGQPVTRVAGVLLIVDGGQGRATLQAIPF